MNQVLFLALILGFISQVAGECANACNGHGTCTSYDMCICYRNWQANDCSERTCQFGLAHVDTPKGDLDNDGFVQDVTAADPVVVENNFVYPYGTTEMFPRMQDSDFNEITNSAHYYMECSNKGTCDRKKGTCKCYDGYDGAACQRASCPGHPNPCSGHGVCKSIQQLAQADNGNIYELWDRHTTMGCECDAGYYGADCSSRKCKNGIDPLYYDDSTTIKYSEFNFATLTWATGGATPYFTDGMANDGAGKWAIRFFDHTGEDWLTSPIPAGATCRQVQDALENLPNEVVPKGTTYCSLLDNEDSVTNQWTGGSDKYAHDGTPLTGDRVETESAKFRLYNYNISFWETAADIHDATTAPTNSASSSGLPYSYISRISPTLKVPPVLGFIYKIKFYGNPGKLQEPEIEIFLDGDRPSLAALEYIKDTTDTPKTAKVITKVWTDGMQGEDKDYFADHCDGVRVIPKIYKSYSQSALVSRDIHYLHFVDVDGTGGNWGYANEMNKLKTCLGGSDDLFYNDANSNENNVETYDWDYGTISFPHIVKLVRTVTTINDGGHYAIILYRSETSASKYSFDSSSVPIHYSETITGTTRTGFFEILNPWVPADETGRNDHTNEYDVYTTKGTLALVSEKSNAYFGYGSKEIYMYNYADHADRIAGNNATHAEHWKKRFYEGSVSCETTSSEKYRSTVSHAAWDATNWEANFVTYCVDKNELIIPLAIGDDSSAGTQKYVNYNPPDINIYTTQKLWTKTPQNYDFAVWGDATASVAKLRASMFKHTIKTDLSLNWGTKTDDDHFRLYKFYPHVDSTYHYVAECSNRGLCDAEGVCECFPGYGNDNCNEQNSLAV
jgi:hypothetical protein